MPTPNGDLKEIRPTGSYVLGVANAEPHTEGSGDQESNRLFQQSKCRKRRGREGGDQKSGERRGFLIDWRSSRRR